MTIADGFYQCRAVRHSYGWTGSQAESVGVVLEVLGPDGKTLGEQVAFLNFSGQAATYSLDKLRSLGWDGVSLAKMEGLGSVVGRCSAKTEPDQKGNLRQRWDIYAGPARMFKNEMTAAEIERFAKRFAPKQNAPQGADAPPDGFDDTGIPF